MITALDRDYTPISMPASDDWMLVKYGNGNAEIDARISTWLDTGRLMAMAYRHALRPRTERFKQELAEFDRFHDETPEPRRSLIWRLPALSIAINRLWYETPLDYATLWRCYALHLADFDQLKATALSRLQASRELAYGMMAGSFIKAATGGTP